MKTYDYIIIGSGIAGACISYELKDEDVLLIDKNESFALGASGAAGAFLNPLLGKNNNFKELVNKSLIYANDFYKRVCPKSYFNKGVLRIPKNEEDRKKFISYEESNEFDYIQKDEGYFFSIGSQVIPNEVCETLTKDIETKFSYEIKHIEFIDNTWLINNELRCKTLIITSGANTKLIDEKYFNIRPVWGQKIDISTTTCVSINYHKECSVSSSYKELDKDKFMLSIGATHHRFNCDKDICNYCVETANLNKMYKHGYTSSIADTDTKDLLKKAADIIDLENIEVLDIKVGARACSFDYFPMLGSLIDSKKTLDMFPYLKKGTKVPSEKFIRYKNLFVINGLGGRGFVLSPYLAKLLKSHIKENLLLNENLTVDRLFKKWVRKVK